MESGRLSRKWITSISIDSLHQSLWTLSTATILLVNGIYHSYLLLVPCDGYKAQSNARVGCPCLSMLAEIDIDFFCINSPKIDPTTSWTANPDQPNFQDPKMPLIPMRILIVWILPSVPGYFLKQGLANNRRFLLHESFDYNYDGWSGRAMADSGDEKLLISRIWICGLVTSCKNRGFYLPFLL